MNSINIPKSLQLFLVIVISLLLNSPCLFSQENEEKHSDSDSTSSSSVTFRNGGGESDNAGPELDGITPEFLPSSLFLNNQFGSFGVRNNGVKAAVKTGHYGFITSYNYSNNDGYRNHSKESWNDVKIALKALPSANTSLVILGSYVNGLARLPGSLTKSEFDLNPYGADQRSIDRDEKTIAGKGRLDIKYDAKFGKALNNEIEISAFGTLGTFSSATREYRIINSYELGFDANYSNTSHFLNRSNKVTVGTDLSAKPTRIEFYDNLGGERGDQLEQIISENTSNTGVYVADRFEILPEKLFITLKGRYDNVVYKLDEQTVPSRSDRRPFTAITPKVTLDYDILHWMSIFGSFNLGFESPADRELESPDPFFLFNPTLNAQTSVNYEAGITANSDKFFADNDQDEDRGIIDFRASYSRNLITNEIVPYEVLGDMFYRNAEKADHSGVNVEFRGSSWGFYADLFYRYSHFLYKSYPTIAIETDSTGTLVQVARNFSGNSEPAVPESFLRAALGYAHHVGKYLKITAEVNSIKVSEMWTNDANSDTTNSYDVMNIRTECEFKYGHFKLLVSAGYNNILNTVYDGLITVNSANYRYYNAGAPGNWACVVNLGYTF